MTFRRLKRITYLGLILLDFLGIIVAFLLAYTLRKGIPTENYYLPPYEYFVISIMLAFLYILILHSSGVHKEHPFGPFQVEIWTIGSGLFKGTILFMAFAFLYREFSISRLIVIMHFFIAILVLSIFRLLWRLAIIKPLVASGARKRIISLVRSDSNGSIAKNPAASSQDIITKVWDEHYQSTDLEKTIILNNIDGIELSEKDFEPDTMLEIALIAAKAGADLRVKPNLPGLLPLNFTLQEIDGIFYWTAGRGLRELYPRTLKRVLDMLFSSIIILICLVPCLVIAIVIASTSNGGVFYRHERIGRKGRRFFVLKFRTMYRDSDDRIRKDPKIYEEFLKGFKLKNDPRITPIGRFLRKISLDELPQIVNIFKGEMSMVGPRPVIEQELDKYGKLKDLLMSVPPGLTGLWQVSGRSDLTYEERVRLDLYYVENWSLALDTQIIARTLPVILFSKGAY
jgi:exopolysaccharide biosynthesis polyprenyl glycosylphosphotransferase